MTAIIDRLTANWLDLQSSGIDIVSAGVKTDDNRVVIGLHPFSWTAAETLRSAFGDAVRVVEDAAAVADSCTGFDNCRPIKGGLKITQADGGWCTSGFIVKRSDNAQINALTAGHCIQVHGGLNGSWSHHADSFGTAGRETWTPGGTGTGDVGLIAIAADEIPTTKNQVHTTGSTVRTVSGWDSAQYVGDIACRAGARSDLDCGEINLVNVTRESAVDGWQVMLVQHKNEVSFDSLPGDSGAPVFFYSGGGVIAQGTHVHSETPDPGTHGWFTPIGWGRTTFSSLFGYYYDVCMYAAC